jgi:two-component system, OmpR family, response regulator VicR
MRILIADDDRELADLLRYQFQRDGHTLALAFDGNAALRAFETEAPDVVILDLKMPKRNGLSVLQELRSMSQVPILVLTGSGDEDTLVEALDRGADDYLAKPFRPRELNARVQALWRRAQKNAVPDRVAGKTLMYGDIALDPRRRAVTVHGQALHLTRHEFALLHYLMQNRDVVVSISEIIVHVWGYDAEGSEAIVKGTVYRLRHKVESDPSHPHYILNAYGEGYIFRFKS